MSSMHKRRHTLALNDGWACAYCGRALVCAHCEGKPETDINAATVDHKVARAQGGTDALDNLVLACGPCNRLKGAHAVPEGATQAHIRYARVWAKLTSLVSQGVRDPMSKMTPREKKILKKGVA